MSGSTLLAEIRAQPDVLEVTARTEDGIVMAVRHREHPTYGLQFHPESIMTRVGKQLLGNFLDRCRRSRAA